MNDPNIRSFESFEAMQHFLQRNEEAAIARQVQQQRGIGYGDTWVRFLPGRLVIFGKVMTPDQITTDEARLGAGPVEISHALQRIRGALDRGYVFGMCYSIVEREGELGSTHRATIWPCPTELFEAARVCAWDIDHLAPPHKRLLELLYQEWRSSLSNQSTEEQENG